MLEKLNDPLRRPLLRQKIKITPLRARVGTRYFTRRNNLCVFNFLGLKLNIKPLAIDGEYYTIYKEGRGLFAGIMSANFLGRKFEKK